MTLGKGALLFTGAIAALAGLGAWLLWDKNHPLGDEQVPGGRAEGRTPLEFDAVQFQRGLAVEMEHTDDWCTAGEIAMDHLVEDDEYYVKLATIDPQH